jgi:hypothetical protein
MPACVVVFDCRWQPLMLALEMTTSATISHNQPQSGLSHAASSKAIVNHKGCAISGVRHRGDFCRRIKSWGTDIITHLYNRSKLQGEIYRMSHFPVLGHQHHASLLFWLPLVAPGPPG